MTKRAQNALGSLDFRPLDRWSLIRLPLIPQPPVPEPWDRGKKNCRDMAVGHVSNVPGTMESCPTYCFCDP